MSKTAPARIVGMDLPVSKREEMGEAELVRHLLKGIRERRCRNETQEIEAESQQEDASPSSDDDDDCEFDFLAHIPDYGKKRGSNLPDDRERAGRWASFLHEARERKLSAIKHLKRDERRSLLSMAKDGHFRGVMDRDEMEEKIAELHALYPWLAKASTAVMNHMRGLTAHGSVPFHTPPLILLGPPGIAKSSWARSLARIFEVPSVEIDIGGTNGAVHSIAGTEKGWGSAGTGRVVQSFLMTHIANPVVVLDEIDKIPNKIQTESISNLPGAFESLKSMIEPSTGKNWICPYQQVPYDLTGISWVMTTNSVNGVPEAFLDRCVVVDLPAPTMKQVIERGREMLTERLGDAETLEFAQDILAGEIRSRMNRSSHTSLRVLERMVFAIIEVLNRPMLH